MDAWERSATNTTIQCEKKRIEILKLFIKYFNSEKLNGRAFNWLKIGEKQQEIFGGIYFVCCDI